LMKANTRIPARNRYRVTAGIVLTSIAPIIILPSFIWRPGKTHSNTRNTLFYIFTFLCFREEININKK